jgi:hypothetical protein
VAIDFEKFRTWAEARFSGDLLVKGEEIKLNSIFKEDYKHHLWCSPKGGKKERDFGVYHCWKSGEKGTLVGLVMKVDGCSYEEALETLNAEDNSLARMEAELERMYNNGFKDIDAPKVVKKKADSIGLPPHTYLITELPEHDLYRSEAEVILRSRKIPVDGLYVCVDGDYRNRIIIPYYDPEGALIYWNGRYMGESDKIPKYLGPPKEIGISKEDVVYMPGEWPEPGVRIHITEGEMDAKSIRLSGLYAAACAGKVISIDQAGVPATVHPGAVPGRGRCRCRRTADDGRASARLVHPVQEVVLRATTDAVQGLEQDVREGWAEDSACVRPDEHQAV